MGAQANQSSAESRMVQKSWQQNQRIETSQRKLIIYCSWTWRKLLHEGWLLLWMFSQNLPAFITFSCTLMSRSATFLSWIQLVPQKNKGNVFDTASESQSSLLAGHSCSKVNSPFKTFFNSQLLLSAPVLNALWIIWRPHKPISTSWCCSLSDRYLLWDSINFQSAFGPSTKVSIILLRFNNLKESLNLARI